jgi:hypothetical protein
MTIKQFWITVIIVAALSFVGGIMLCRSSHKEQQPIVYDLEYLTDSILAANKTIDTVIIKQDAKIIHEKGKITKEFINIDSLSFDSAFVIWTRESRYYKPIFN